MTGRRRVKTSRYRAATRRGTTASLLTAVVGLAGLGCAPAAGDAAAAGAAVQPSSTTTGLAPTDYTGSAGASTASTAAPSAMTTPAATAPPTTASATAAADDLLVVDVTDGDTLTVADGRRVRLAQVDAPERNECFGSESTAALREQALGRSVLLRRPPGGPDTDRYGRTLADVMIDGASVNLALVTAGAAEWHEQFVDEDVDLGRQLDRAERDARAANRGLWSACSTGARPAAGPMSVTTATVPQTTEARSVAGQAGACDDAYPDVCIPATADDLDCADVPYRRFRVLPPDPHRFDGDHDGLGCQST